MAMWPQSQLLAQSQQVLIVMNVMFMDIMSEVVKRAYLMFKNREFSVDFTPVHTKQLTFF